LPPREVMAPGLSLNKILETPRQKPVNKLLETLIDIGMKVVDIIFHVKG
jgi:hypothetical protein